MGDCIVHMQQVDLVVNYYIDHCTGQGSFIWGIIEEGICRYTNFVIKNICVEFAESYRLLVGYEVYQVPLISQSLSQFCCQYSATTKCGVTNNSDSHSFLIQLVAEGKTQFP